MAFTNLLLFLIFRSEALDSTVYEHSCGDRYNCTQENPVSYLIYEINLENTHKFPENCTASVHYYLSDNDYDLKLIGVYIDYVLNEDLHEPSSVGNFGASLDYDVITYSSDDTTDIQIDAFELKKQQRARICVLVEVLEDSNPFDSVSSDITFRAGIWLFGKHFTTSDWKHLEEIDEFPDDTNSDTENKNERGLGKMIIHAIIAIWKFLKRYSIQIIIISLAVLLVMLAIIGYKINLYERIWYRLTPRVNQRIHLD